MTTIHDIAKKSGYSAATVSRVLNQKNYVSKEARAKILAVVAELQYVPNDIARDLSFGKTHQIGVVLPHTGHPFFTQILNGVIQSALASAYRVVILPSEYDETLEQRYLEQLRSKTFDALIFTSRALPLATLARYLPFGPVVCCENPERPDLPAVYSQREKIYQTVFAWMQQKGVRAPVILLSRSYEASATSKLTFSAYKKVSGHYPAASHVLAQMVSFEDGVLAGEKIISSHLAADAIFSNGDDVAAGVVTAYRRHHLTPPLIIGQDNQVSGRLLNLATIDHHFDRMGALAFELATKKIPPQQIEVEADFIARS